MVDTYLVYNKRGTFQLAINADAPFKLTGNVSAYERAVELANETGGTVRTSRNSEPLYTSESEA
jgi:hypothetical protein